MNALPGGASRGSRPARVSASPTRAKSHDQSNRGRACFSASSNFFNTLSTNWSEDPGARGAAKMTAGGVLVAEGVFRRGAVAGPDATDDGSEAALLGGVLGIIFGIIFINVAGFVEGPGIDDPAEITGHVVAVERAGTSGENDTPMYRTRIAYTVDGESYEFSPRGRSSWRPNVGADVDIAYSRSNPGQCEADRRHRGMGAADLRLGRMVRGRHPPHSACSSASR